MEYSEKCFIKNNEIKCRNNIVIVHTKWRSTETTNDAVLSRRQETDLTAIDLFKYYPFHRLRFISVSLRVISVRFQVVPYVIPYTGHVTTQQQQQ